jgi:isoquinoline 1-oxidoreductase beta subunit
MNTLFQNDVDQPTDNKPADLNRRNFLKLTSLAGLGLTLGFYLPFGDKFAVAAMPDVQTFAPNAWLRIELSGVITITVGKSEMGQGIRTSLPMIVAEELEADWQAVKIEQAVADAKYGNMMTGGSSSVRSSFANLRKAGAAAREMLVSAAAQKFGVPASECKAEMSTVVHPATNRKFTYAELVETAAKLPVPQDPTLKDPKNFTIVGKKMARRETPEKVDGSAVFGIDVKVPNMLVAVVARCPVFGGKVASFNDAAAKKIKGVRHVVQISSGIAVVADGYWPATQGRDALNIKWTEGETAKVSTASIMKEYKQLAEKSGLVAKSTGDAAKALDGATKKLSAAYHVPYLAHVTMEPVNATASVRADACDVWAPTQAPNGVQELAAKLTGLPKEAIKVNTTLLGGGFGRKFEMDFITESIELSKALNLPVKVIWSREDDVQHDVYRPTAYNALAAGLDADGYPVAWTNRIVSASILARVFPNAVKNGIDSSSVEGAANLPYAIPNVQVEYTRKETGVPVGFWRSVGSSHNAFITESFIDELAAAAGKDPFEYRKHLLKDSPRLRGVLELVAEKAAWTKPLPAGVFRGIACHECFGSAVAEVAEVSINKDKTVKVHRVVCAIDCGPVVNPDTVIAQVQGAVADGLTPTLKAEITIAKGRAVQRNFHEYELLRMNEMPKVEVYIMPSTEKMGGVGEPGLPPVAPAVANAVFAATGKRVRKLPIRPEDLGGKRNT